MKKQSMDKHNETGANDFLNMIAAPGLIRSSSTTDKEELEEDTAIDKEETVQAKKNSSVSEHKTKKKTIRKKKVSTKQQNKKAANNSEEQEERLLMTVRVDAQLYQLAKYFFQPQTKVSYKIMNEILKYWLEQQHPEMLDLFNKKKNSL